MYKMSKEIKTLFQSEKIVVFGGIEAIKNIEKICSVFKPDFIWNTEDNFCSSIKKIPYISTAELLVLRKKHKKISVILAEDGSRCDIARNALKDSKIPVIHYYNALYPSYKVSSRDLIKRKLFSYKDNHNNTITIIGNRIPNMEVHFEGYDNHIFLDEVYFDAETIIRMVGYNNVLQIGKGTSIGQSAFTFLGNGRVTIGEDCLISCGILCHCGDGHPIFSLDTFERTNPQRDIIVGNHTWIGIDVSLWNGAEIGAGSIVAAKALVPGKKFEENSLLAGLPAKVVKSNVSWARDSTKMHNYETPEECHDQYVVRRKHEKNNPENKIAENIPAYQ